MNNWDITKTIGYSVLRLSREMTKKMNQQIALLNDDVTMQQGAVLYFIARSENEELIQQDIAELMGINKSAILRTIDILEKKGFVKRSPVPNDRRKNKIDVTETGLEVVDAFIHSIEEKDQELKRAFSDSEVSSFLKIIEALSKKVCEI